MPRGKKKQVPATKRLQKRKELCPVRKADHIAVFAGTWKNPNDDPIPESRDAFTANQETTRYGNFYRKEHGEGVTGKLSHDGHVADLYL